MASASGSMSPRSLKRQHDDNVVQEWQSIHTTEAEEPLAINSRPGNTAIHNCSRLSTPARTETDSLSEIGSSTPPLTHAAPATAFSVLNGNSQPPKKKVKLTFAEQEEKRMMKEIKDRERQEEKTKKEVEKREKEQDKARREAEKEAERKKREADREEKRLVKEVERAEKERERKAKEDEKRKKEEEKLRIEEEKKKKERSQKKLNAFFTKAPALKLSPMKATSPDPSAATSTTISPSKKAKSEYETQFSSFFIKENVTLAPTTRFERDKTAVSHLEKVLDSYLNGEKAPKRDQSFIASKLFNIPTSSTIRGKSIIPVKDIMSQILGGAGRPIDLTTDSQNLKIKNTRNMLKGVPYKVLKFAEDVRPPYTGTYTKQPLSGMRTLARNPTKRDLPGVDYDYDSEAEWEEPGDDEEDLGSEGEDEEDDGEEDLDGFLDDAEDETINARKLVMNGDLEPKVTGLCWEDEKGRGPELKMYGYVMEIMHENPYFNTPIDPFTTHYWDSPETKQKSMEPPRAPLHPLKGANNGAAKTVKMFGTSDISKPSMSVPTSKGSKKYVAAEDMPAFKNAVQGSGLSKLGLIEVLNKQFTKTPKSSIKSTLEAYAKRVGVKEMDKKWEWVENGAS